jgi:amino acid adenylation domain-containing protein
MIVVDELNILEVLGDHDRPVLSGEKGRVVLTNLYNYALPLLRYELQDRAVLGNPGPDSPFTTIREINGRTYNALPIVLDNGEHDEINPHGLAGFYFPGVEKLQYVSKRPDYIEILYVGTHDVDEAIRNDFYRILTRKGALRTTFRVRRVEEIAKDPQTGKLYLVKIEGNPALPPSRRPWEMAEGKKHDLLYKLAKNGKGQYSMAPVGNVLPGWEDTGKTGAISDCLEYIKELAPEMGARDVKASDIQHLFEEQVRRAPNKPAVTCEKEVITYNELNNRANLLAERLRALGIRENKIVAICLPRSIDMVTAILGTLKAGGTWLPLDPHQPEERQHLVLKDTDVTVLLTYECFESDFAGYKARTVLLDGNWPSMFERSESNPQTAFEPSSLAYIMHTSGSTGRPKGVMITRANLSFYARAMGRALSITPDDTYLHTAAITFSSSVRQLMVPLTHGATVVVATTDKIQQPLALFQMVKDRRVTVIDLVPFYWRNCISVLSHLSGEARAALLDNQLRLIVTASELLSPDLPQKWARKFKHAANIINMFGQTETTGIVTTCALSQTEHAGPGTVPIGGPIAKTQVYLLDARQQPVPIGAEGEIYVEGPGLGLGYLGQPDLTAEKFIPSPYSRTPGARLYKTGDLARFRSDGEMEFVSRVDDQVKIRGIRIELGEIRSVLSQHPGVRHSAVVAVGDRPERKRLVAYVAPKAEGALTSVDLRDFLKRKLPDYMIPAAFMMMDALPLTPSGKVNRQALPATDHTTAQKTFVAPRTPVEEVLARIWAEVLGLERVGVYDDFFELGGHSLAVTQIISQVVEQFNVEPSLRLLFEAPTVADMAIVVTQAQAKKTGAENLAPMLADLESLSDEDAQELVARATARNTR